MTTGRRFPILPIAVGILFGFIGGYFAGGGGRPGSVARPAGDGAAATQAGSVEELQRAADRDPQNPRVLTALGNALYDAEDWDSAIDAYEKARRKAPEDPNLLSDLGAAYRNRGDFQRAVPLFERAHKNDPKHWQSLLNLVLIHAYDLHDSAAAQKWLDELKRRYPDIPDLDRIQERVSAIRAS
jgi:tetratricopeptide (TPR) repeat protein